MLPELTTTRPALQAILKEASQAEGKGINTKAQNYTKNSKDERKCIFKQERRPTQERTLTT